MITDDIEQQVRDALRRNGEALTPAMLRHRDGPLPAPGSRPVRPRSWTWLASAAAVAAVLLVVLAAVVTRNGGSDRTPAASGHGPAALSLAGTAWNLTEVRDVHGRTVAIPQRIGAGVSFERDGTMLDGYDGLNDHTAAYSVDGHGDLVLRSARVSAVGYAGDDAAKLAAIDGIGTVVDAGVVQVQLDGKRLRLSAHGYALTFAFGAPVAASSGAPVSGTATR